MRCDVRHGIDINGPKRIKVPINDRIRGKDRRLDFEKTTLVEKLANCSQQFCAESQDLPPGRGAKTVRCPSQTHDGRPRDYSALTRSMYSPVRVSTLMRSPISTKAGTVISAPVSTVHGLVTLVAVFPRAPGSQYSTLRTT